jgi:hypothetical protein
MTIERIERIGWFTWEVWWRVDDQCGGVILGSPRYILSRLLMWME